MKTDAMEGWAKDEILRRVDLAEKCLNDPKLIAVELEILGHPELGIKHFFKHYVYTDKNTNLFAYDDPSVYPMIPFPFQREAIEEIRKSIMAGTTPISEREELTNVFIEKSRQMGLSWIIVGIFVYGYVFHNHKYHCVSQKETDVDKTGDMRSLFEKARFIINNLPKWMIPRGYQKKKGTEHNKHLTISREDGTGAITGESAHPSAGRSGTYTAIFLDEMAFMANATAIATASGEASPCTIYNSTPNGEGNEFFRKRRMTQRGEDDEGNPVPPRIKGLRYHRSEHPHYDDARYKRKTKGKSEQAIAQELEINYNTAIVGRVYTDFPGDPMKGLDYDPKLHTYVWIDNSHGGADPHAILVVQTEGHWINIIDCCEFHGSVDDMAFIARNEPKKELTNEQLKFLDRYSNYNHQRAVFVSDPYDTHSTINDATIYEKYRKVGIYLRIPQQRKKEKQILNTKGNIYRIRYAERCNDYASAMMNARYPDRPETSNAVTVASKPIHDWTSHYRTATEYGIQYLLENPVKKPDRVPKVVIRTRDPVTRELNPIQSGNKRQRRDPVTRELIG